MSRIFYANGDSMVFGQDLDPDNQRDVYDFTIKHRQQGFTGILSDRLGFNTYINKALPGGSNERIYRKTVKHISQLLREYDPKDMFVFIGLTSPFRREFYVNTYNNWYPFIASYSPKDPIENAIWKTITQHDSIESYYIKDALNILSLQNFLKIHKIPYLITFSLSAKHDFTHNVQCTAPYLKDQLYTKRLYDDISFWEYVENAGCKKGVTLHPIEDGHALWAEKMLTHILQNNLLSTVDYE